MADDLADPLGGVTGLQHVIANEVVQIADRLHRDRLVKQLQGLLGAYPQESPKGRAVLGELVEDLGTRPTEPLAEVAQLGSKIGEVRRDGKGLGSGDEKAIGLARVLPLLEHLRERHGLVVAVVAEDPQDDGVTAAPGAQADSSRSSCRLNALGLVVALDVGAKGPLLGVRACGLVVGDPVGGHEQCRECVNEGRLPRADVTCEQRGLSSRRQAPHLTVEGAPVEHLKVLQAVPGAMPASELNAREESFIHRFAPRWRTPGACRRSRTASRRRRRPSRCGEPPNDGSGRATA